MELIGNQHMIAHNVEELLQIKGSKYFQSDTKGIYEAVKKELNEGKKVLFCGTPCQVAAIKSYIDKNTEKLYCMDFICRSINSPKAFKAYIEELEEKYKSKVSKVHLKNKKYGWQSLASQVCFENGQEIIQDRNKDWWVKGFIFNDLYTRESCYHCQYKVLPRVNADVTIGDFWGIQNQTQDDMFKGISVTLVNTEKGTELIEKSKAEFEYEEHKLQEVLPGNPALLKNPIKTNKQKLFFSLLKDYPFSYAVKQCIKVPINIKIKDKFIKGLKKIYKKIKVFISPRISTTKYIYYNYFCRNIVRNGSAKVIPYKGTD